MSKVNRKLQFPKKILSLRPQIRQQHFYVIYHFEMFKSEQCEFGQSLEMKLCDLSLILLEQALCLQQATDMLIYKVVEGQRQTLEVK